MKKAILTITLLAISLSASAYDYPGRLTAQQLQQRESVQSYYDTDKFRHKEVMEQLRKQNNLMERKLEMEEQNDGNSQEFKDKLNFNDCCK